MTDSSTARIGPYIGPARGIWKVPGDKSLSHRALIFAAMAEGTSRVAGLGTGQDIASTRSVLRALGVDFDGNVVESKGIDGWQRPEAPLDCGNSGTTLRLMAGALTGRPFEATLVGDESLSRRPMRRLVAPLGMLGARIEPTVAGTAPIVVTGSQLHGADIVVPMASAQVRTAFALGALQADRPSRIDSPPGFRDHTERFLAAMGRGTAETLTRFRVDPGPLEIIDYHVPGDPSSAAFLLAVAAIVPGSEVTVEGISLNPGRLGFLRILDAMGAGVDVQEGHTEIGEPVGNVTVSHAPLTGIRISAALTVAALDELPLVAVVAAFAGGETVVSDASELRAKESDRIVSTVSMIRALGGKADETSDGFRVGGSAGLRPGTVETDLDHRIAMAAAVAGAAAGPVTIIDPEVAGVSWPTFYEDLEALWSS